ncbi:deoxyribodipyrimidine photo-lyase [Cognatishimia sp. SS12]|uniref:cryptochrome/photolyase family protein n=1 Tax=Cognatishimia sp. SS12 TaxID=2979465 RepID=UPI00232C81F9|nr:deoxyribodipyrimidine photo-lyase [Cognatishimia sp. SS12]MDC0736955.1 deoxyribodipyrimidine photo-lyase [Cognatishimia sp. SS12]
MPENAPILLWMRRDFRLADHPALAKAAALGRPVVPVFVLDEVAETYGAAPKWRLEAAIRHFAAELEKIGSRLILRRGGAQEVLLALAAEIGASQVLWTRAYDPDAIARDTRVKAALKQAGYAAESLPGHLMFEPWDVAPKQGNYFKVYSAFWRAVKERPVADLSAKATQLTAPKQWPHSDDLAGWQLSRAMNQGAAVLAKYAVVGEAAAQARLDQFIDTAIDTYKEARDFPDRPATSGLSENLAWGEISPARLWFAGQRALEAGAKGAEHFLKEVVWREFAYHLVYHTPRITSQNWRGEWDGFGWSEAEDAAVRRWQQGRTGVPLVDAAMREMYVTGTMHNRGRMIVASYLTKHMLTHWRIGQKWFEDCLIDWDPAANAMGWQWVAGSGPDAAPYFRVFNPQLQAKKFDADSRYVSRFVAELVDTPAREALDFYAACPRSWGLTPKDDYPDPVVGIDEGRKRALAAYENR